MKRVLHSPLITGLLFVLALALLVTGSVGSVRALPNSETAEMHSTIETTKMGVAILQNGETCVNTGSNGLMNVGGTDVASGESFKVGKNYNLNLSVKNTGDVEGYVRITIYRYWASQNTNASGWVGGYAEKRTDLDPEMIELDIAEENGWVIDTSAPSEGGERIVIYRGNQAALQQNDSLLFLKSVRINGDILEDLKPYDDGSYGYYAYDNATFMLEIKADIVQTHSGDAARTGTWGFVK